MLSENGILIDKNSFDKIWDVVIKPTMEDYRNRFAEIAIAYNAQDIIWDEYIRFNQHCKKTIHGRCERKSQKQ